MCVDVSVHLTQVDCGGQRATLIVSFSFCNVPWGLNQVHQIQWQSFSYWAISPAQNMKWMTWNLWPGSAEAYKGSPYMAVLLKLSIGVSRSKLMRKTEQVSFLVQDIQYLIILFFLLFFSRVLHPNHSFFSIPSPESLSPTHLFPKSMPPLPALGKE